MSFKILWFSLPALFGNRDSYAVEQLTLLESLASHNFDIKALTTTYNSHSIGLSKGHKILITKPTYDKAPIVRLDHNKVSHLLYPVKLRDLYTLNRDDQDTLMSAFISLIEEYKPNLILTSGNEIITAAFRREARLRNLPVVYLHNQSLACTKSYTLSIPECNEIFVSTKATAQYIAYTEKLHVTPIGNFVSDKQKFYQDKQSREYVTIVNPCFNKGYGIFIKLASVFAKLHPEQKFLVVNQFGTHSYNLVTGAYHNVDGTSFYQFGKKSPTPNIECVEQVIDVKEIFARTKVLVMPSLTFEHSAKFAIEANFNDIPVLGTTSGCLVETIGEGGICVDAPASCLNDVYCVPTDEEIAPFVQALERLINEDWSQACRKEAEKHSLQVVEANFLKQISPLIKYNVKLYENSLMRSPNALRHSKRLYNNNK